MISKTGRNTFVRHADASFITVEDRLDACQLFQGGYLEKEGNKLELYKSKPPDCTHEYAKTFDASDQSCLPRNSHSNKDTPAHAIKFFN